MKSTSITLPNDVMLGGVKELLAEGRQVVIMTKGVSMLPFIVGKRDSVVLEKRASVAPGDIALAEIAPGHYVLHRVREVSDDGVVLQGDGNYRGQEKCRPENIAGTVVAVQTPGKPDRDPYAAAEMRRWRRWTRIPAIVRRYYLAFFRRIKHITI
ncbi:MAG: S24/S26 family peptidase [Bacteroidales bacterium]|nr:S24/S26 family peptidase [Bacteroidales bacterium]